MCIISLLFYTKQSTPGPPCVQENDIFLGWEKGTGKKWGKSKRKGGTDLSLEEMKKQAAVQCLRSASDEVRPLLKAVFQSVCYFVFPQPFSLLNSQLVYFCEFVRGEISRANSG